MGETTQQAAKEAACCFLPLGNRARAAAHVQSNPTVTATLALIFRWTTGRASAET